MLEQQVEPGLALEPDFITVICGANDVLLATRPDVGGLRREDFDEILRRLREGAPEAMLVTATAPESWQFMELRPRTEARLIEATDGAERRHPGGGGALRRALPAGRRPPGAAATRRRSPPTACTRRPRGHQTVARESAAMILSEQFRHRVRPG